MNSIKVGQEQKGKSAYYKHSEIKCILNALNKNIIK